MEARLPYYMAYPMPLLYDDSSIERQDLEYMKSMYPDLAKRVMIYVEDECEKMMYDGSMIYDEYPDQLQIRLMCNRVYDKVIQSGMEDDLHLKEMIQILVFHELFHRRCEYRRFRRKYY